MPRQQPLARARSLPTPAVCHHPEGVNAEAVEIRRMPMQPAAMVQRDGYVNYHWWMRRPADTD